MNPPEVTPKAKDKTLSVMIALLLQMMWVLSFLSFGLFSQTEPHSVSAMMVSMYCFFAANVAFLYKNLK